MRKYILLLIIIIVAIVYNVFFAEKHTRVIRVGVECDHAPYSWEEKKESDSNMPLVNHPGFYAEGYDVQMAKAVADLIGVEVEFYKINFDRLIDSLLMGEIDVIFSGMVDTETRKEMIDFTVPYEVMKTEYVAVVNTRSSYVNASSIRELDGARMIAQKNSRFDTVLEQIPNIEHFPPLGVMADVIDEVIKFNVDGTVVNYDTGLSYENSYPNLKVIHFHDNQGFDLGFTGLCAGVRKSDKKLLEELNDAINSISIRQRQRIMDLTIKSLWVNLE